MNPEFTIKWDGPTLILLVTQNDESFVLDACAKLEETLAEQPLAEGLGVVVDFGRIELFGSMMLEAIRLLWTRLSNVNGRLACCGGSKIVSEVLELSRMNRICPHYDSRAAAVAAVSG